MTRNLKSAAVLLVAALLAFGLARADGETNAVAAGTSEVLAIGGTFAADLTLQNRDGSRVVLEDEIAYRTFVYYMSATCPHCINALPEVVDLARDAELDLEVIVIVSGANKDDDVARFLPNAPSGARVFRDRDRSFSSANEIRSTPVGFLVRPGQQGLEVLGAWKPFRPGASTLVRMRAAVAAGRDPFSAFEKDRHQGRWVCASCHTQEHESWRLTHHARAWWTLERGKRLGDDACISCHVTGLDKPGGYDRSAAREALTDVTCESCHGPGGPHDGRKTEARGTCASCHDADHTISFELERALPLIDHFAWVGMAPDAARARRLALLEGTAPRPLTEFPSGVNVGSAACAECHPAEDAHWRGTAHARSRVSLEADQAEGNPDCLVCHATVGAVEEGRRTYLEEGVGCESCHGPGEQHVAAKGGRDTILGLGQSCPDCVLDAICTRCHTALRDPDWDLHPALERTRHPAPPPPGDVE